MGCWPPPAGGICCSRAARRFVPPGALHAASPPPPAQPPTPHSSTAAPAAAAAPCLSSGIHLASAACVDPWPPVLRRCLLPRAQSREPPDPATAAVPAQPLGVLPGLPGCAATMAHRAQLCTADHLATVAGVLLLLVCATHAQSSTDPGYSDTVAGSATANLAGDIYDVDCPCECCPLPFVSRSGSSVALPAGTRHFLCSIASSRHPALSTACCPFCSDSHLLPDHRPSRPGCRRLGDRIPGGILLWSRV